MAHSQIAKALRATLEKQFPKVAFRQADNARGRKLDFILNVSGKRVGFEIKATNFYDALGRAILWENELDGTYLVVPNQILPPKETLSRIPSTTGVVTYEVKDRRIRFEVVKQSQGHLLPGFTDQIQLTTPPLTQPARHPRPSLVSPKALQVVKYLISHKETTQTRIAQDTKVSTGMVNKVISALIERDLVSYRRKRLVVFDIWRLLNEISWNRPLKSLKSAEIYLSDAKTLEDVEAKLVETCVQMKTRYALTLFSGASKHIGYGMKYGSVQTYVADPSLILDQLGSGSPGADAVTTLEIYAVDDWNIIEEAESINGRVVCSPTQLVLDLVSYGGAGRDWAVKLYEATLAKKD